MGRKKRRTFRNGPAGGIVARRAAQTGHRNYFNLISGCAAIRGRHETDGRFDRYCGEAGVRKRAPQPKRKSYRRGRRGYAELAESWEQNNYTKCLCHWTFPLARPEEWTCILARRLLARRSPCQDKPAEVLRG